MERFTTLHCALVEFRSALAKKVLRQGYIYFTKIPYLVTKSTVTGAQLALRVSIVTSQTLVALPANNVGFARALSTKLL